jgi:hypothetical protein
MNETISDDALKEKAVVTADGVELGRIDAITATHVRLHTPDDMVVSSQLWLPRTMIAGIEGDLVRLNRERGQIHDAVYSLAPSQQREYATLNLGIRVGRERGLRLA